LNTENRKKTNLRELVDYNTRIRQEEEANRMRDQLIIDIVNNNQSILTDAKAKATALRTKFAKEIQRRANLKKPEQMIQDRQEHQTQEPINRHELTEKQKEGEKVQSENLSQQYRQILMTNANKDTKAFLTNPYEEDGKKEWGQQEARRIPTDKKSQTYHAQQVHEESKEEDRFKGTIIVNPKKRKLNKTQLDHGNMRQGTYVGHEIKKLKRS
jgi:hypothetical protein